MDGRAFGVYWNFVEKQRQLIIELEAQTLELGHRYTEAWFEPTAMGQEGATAEDKQEATINLEHAIEQLRAARLALKTAQRRLPLFEKTLDQYTPT